MPVHSKRKRFLSGFILVLAVLILAFVVITPWIHTYGATPEEVALVYPGDEILTHPIVLWTHGMTIQATPEQVWPWIVQMGDTRAAFYSYTFIEKLFPGENLYNNANRIVPEWQNTQPGQGIIDDMLAIKDLAPGKWMLASSKSPDIGWTWLWQIQPQGQGQTRLMVRMRIQMPEGTNLGPLGWFIDVSGFVMEKGMMQGLKDRAEGNIPLSFSEPLGIVLWLFVLVGGLVSAGLFVRRQDWRPPLAMGLLSVVGLLVITFIQPDLGTRALFVAALLAGVWWVNNNT